MILNEEDQQNSQDELFNQRNKKLRESKIHSITAPKDAFDDLDSSGQDDLFKASNSRKIANREDDYKKKRYRPLSPERFDPLKDFDKLPDSKSRTYGDIMLEQTLENERMDLMKQQLQKKKEAINNISSASNIDTLNNNNYVTNKKSRLESDALSATSASSKATKTSKTNSDWDKLEKANKWETQNATPNKATVEGMITPRRKRWDLTPVGEGGVTPNGKYKY